MKNFLQMMNVIISHARWIWSISQCTRMYWLRFNLAHSSLNKKKPPQMMTLTELFCLESSSPSNDFFSFSNIHNWSSLFVLSRISAVILAFFSAIFSYKWNTDLTMKTLNTFEKLNALTIIYIQIYNLNAVILI